MRYLLLIVVPLVLSGCFRPSVPEMATPALAATPTAASGETLATAREALVYYEARVAALESAAAAERLEWQRTLLSWASGIALLCALLCIAAAVFVPVAKKTLITAAIACIGVVITAYLLGQVLVYLPIIGIGAALLALGYCIYLLKDRWAKSVDTVEHVLKEGAFESWDKVKKEMERIQGRGWLDIDKLAKQRRK